MKYKVISFDMFQTLVDVNSRKQYVWADILKEVYTSEKAEMFWNVTLNYHSEYAKDIRSGREVFQPMRETFAVCYEKILRENNIEIDKKIAVSILFREHGKAPVYPDVKDFFSQLDPKYRIWISSDADREMVSPLLSLFKYEYAFISEEIGAYKHDEQGRFFKYILETTGVRPEEILHVGDGLADIAGAKQAGIATCWINRERKAWNHTLCSDYTIESLLELNSIIR